MNRRNFIVALGAALLARKLPPNHAIGSGKANDVQRMISSLFDHKRRIDANTENVRVLTEALRLNVPTGFKPVP